MTSSEQPHGRVTAAMDDSRGRIEKLKTKLNRRCLAEPDFQRYFQVTPPVTLWPKVEVVASCRRASKKWLRHSNTPSNIACTRRRADVIVQRAAGDA